MIIFWEKTKTRRVPKREKYQQERDTIIADNKELNKRVKELENEYKKKNTTFDLKFDNRKRGLEKEFKEMHINEIINYTKDYINNNKN